MNIYFHVCQLFIMWQKFISNCLRMLTYKTEGILYIMRFSLRASDGSAFHIPRQVYVFRFTTRQSIMDFLLSAIPCDGIGLRTFVSSQKNWHLFILFDTWCIFCKTINRFTTEKKPWKVTSHDDINWVWRFLLIYPMRWYITEFSCAERNIKEQLGNAKSDQNFRG